MINLIYKIKEKAGFYRLLFAVSSSLLIFTLHAQASTTTILHSFANLKNDAEHPYAGLIQYPVDGSLYGTAFNGNVFPGEVFKITTSGSISTIHQFGDGSVMHDGSNPQAALTYEASTGYLYGTTVNGGSSGYGTIFQYVPGGIIMPPTFTIQHSFGDGSVTNDGLYPMASLLRAADGNFYGTASEGGSAHSGIVFKLTSAGAYTILHHFGDGSVSNDGTIPVANLIQAADGNFYGTTGLGGAHAGGTVFKITSGGAVTIIHSFGGFNDGAYPQAGLIQSTDGNLYGTTVGGSSTTGTLNDGIVFKMSTAGAETILHSFGSVTNDGIGPVASLVRGTDGNFYGTTSAGGSASKGTTFKITSAGSVTILHSFGDGSVTNDGSDPEACLIQATDGNFYGTTAGGGASNLGTVFKLVP